jgi:formate/nitrite transporter FocA (FNT family)
VQAGALVGILGYSGGYTGEVPTTEEKSPNVDLTAFEKREVERRAPPRAAVVFETIRREGLEELERPAISLLASGLAAGLAMGFSLLIPAVLSAHVPEAPWKPLIVNMGYPVGFLIVILGRQQLFTENTLTVILPLLDGKDKLKILARVARLWALVLFANLVGAGLIALALARSNTFDPAIRQAMDQLGHLAAAPDFTTLLLRGIFAGWLIALMVWLLPGAEQSRLWVVLIMTYLVAMASLSHIIAGSVEVLYLVANGSLSMPAYLGNFALPVFIGNAVGGIALVALLNYGQVVAE